MNSSIKMLLVGTVATLVLAACEDDAVETTERWTDKSLPANMPVPLRWYTQAKVDAGARLYLANCAECHGAEAEGKPDWQARGPDGKRAPPPLNGTGHGWHHSVSHIQDLFMVGSHGTEGETPSWMGKLRNEDSLAIIAWLQSRWSDEIYAKWHYMHHRDQGH